MSEDITYCFYTKCKNLKCERHPLKIKDHYIQHSYGFFKECAWWDLPEHYFSASNEDGDHHE